MCPCIHMKLKIDVYNIYSDTAILSIIVPCQRGIVTYSKYFTFTTGPCWQSHRVITIDEHRVIGVNPKGCGCQHNPQDFGLRG